MKRHYGGDYSSELEFVSSHFCDIGNKSKGDLEIEDFELILNSSSLVAESEDYLYEEISKHFSEDAGWFRLLEFIRFDFLSVLCIKDFIEWTKEYFEYFSINIWNQICDRLVIDISNSVHPRFSTNRSESLELDFKSGFPLEGIISNLSSRFGGNVSDLGIVSVTSKSTCSSNFLPKNAVDLTVDSKFGSQSEPNQWLCYDFKDRRVEVRHYSIRSQFDAGAGASHPKSWVIEGSDDCENWTELDSQTNNSDLNDQNKICTWPTKIRMKSRYIRLRQTGLNHNGTDFLWISSFELFGSLMEQTHK
jgi:hypothetical protein